MRNQDRTTIAIPIFNETNGIVHLIEETLTLPLQKEVIVIDDGSTNEQTQQIVGKIKKKYPQVTILTNKRNLGKSKSVQLALKIAKGNIFVVLDGDAELCPKDILKLYSALKKDGARLANGSRMITQTKPLSFSQTVTRLARVTFGSFIYFFYGVKIKDVLSGYKLFYTNDFKNHIFSTKRFGLESDLLVATVNNQRKIVEVDVSYSPRSYKEGKRINSFDGIEILRCILTNIRLGKSLFRTPFGVFCIGVLLWMLTFSIYNLHANSSSTSDSLPNNFTTVNILYNNRLDLTNFKPYFQKRHQKSVVTKNKEGLLYAKTPVINGILAAPYFFMFDKLHNVHRVSVADFLHKDYETYYQSVGKYYAALLTSLSVVVIFLIIHALFGNIVYAFLGTLAYGFGTMTYSTAAQGNWQHAPSLLLISSSFYLLLFFLKSKRVALFNVASVLLALATLIRITNMLFFIAIVAVLLFYKPYRKTLKYPAIIFFLLITLWQTVTWAMGVPGGYNEEIMRSIHSFNVFSTLKVTASLLISPNVGLLIFCPIFIFSFFGMYELMKRSKGNKNDFSKPLFIYLTTAVISFFLVLFFNSFWWAWEGGYSWGPRLLTEAAPFLIYLGIYFFSTLRRISVKITVASLYLFLFLLSTLFIHAVGVYADDNDWHNIYYKEGIDRMTMAWQTRPGVLWYYLAQRKIFFTQSISNFNNKIVIEKNFYYIDVFDGKFNKIKTTTKLL